MNQPDAIPARMPPRILLSAYACEPGKGSEPAVGWNWSIHLAALGYEVWVITRANNRASIEAALPAVPQAQRLHFQYFDLAPALLRAKRTVFGTYLYYALWQRGAARLAGALLAQKGIALVHHVTFAGIRQPSHMGRLGIPFVFGPVGGGERCPPALRRHLSLRARATELLRDFANQVARANPAWQRCIASAERILVTSEQTRALLPAAAWPKTEVRLAIGSDARDRDAPPEPPFKLADAQPRPAHVLFVGRFVEWKGMGLGLRAFEQFARRNPDARLTLVGSGRAAPRWRALAAELGVSDRVAWLDWQPREDLDKIYRGATVFLFPSLHDSGGMVVLEAMSLGIPVVCLDLGGPGAMVDDSCGRVVGTQGRSEADVVSALAQALAEVDAAASRGPLEAGARRRARELSWPNAVAGLYASLAGLLDRAPRS